MAEKGTINPDELAKVQSCVAGIGETGKLSRLRRLIEELRGRHPENWRLVVFTTRLETLEMLRAALIKSGVFVGTIAGGRAGTNERTLRDFRAESPNVNVVLSTVNDD